MSNAETTRSAERKTDQSTLLSRLRYFLTPWDGRYEDLNRGKWYLNVFRDMTAGLIVAMIAIPLAMGFAMAQPPTGTWRGSIQRHRVCPLGLSDHQQRR